MRATQNVMDTLDKETGMPRKRFYRARAHSNPLNDVQFDNPRTPSEMDWSEYFPAYFPPAAADAAAAAAFVSKDAAVAAKGVRFADVGCGFGGMTIKLAELFPDELMVGMELRDKVSEYVKERILALRRTTDQYHNCACLRANAMKHIPNYFAKGQLTKLFFLFPDPHFKVANHRRRIITRSLLAEYAYVLAEGATLYTVTDVPELGGWMSRAMEEHPLFERLTEAELAADPVTPLLLTTSEEGKKVERNEGVTCVNVFRRIKAPAGLNVS